MPRGTPITEGEIHQRLVRLRNLERLHAAARERITRLEENNRLLQRQLVERDRVIERLLLRVEELERMVFGRKRQRDVENQGPSSDAGSFSSQ